MRSMLSVHEACNKHFSNLHQVCHAVDTMGDTRVLFNATALILCAACALDVRHPAIPSQRACASAVEKTSSFSFCQVDMYANVLSVAQYTVA